MGKKNGDFFLQNQNKTIFAPPKPEGNARWCKGSTRDFGSLGLGSNPGRAT